MLGLPNGVLEAARWDVREATGLSDVPGFQNDMILKIVLVARGAPLPPHSEISQRLPT